MHPSNNISSRFDYLCGGIILLTVAFCYVLMQLCWLIDITSVHFALPVSFVAASVCMVIPVKGNEWKRSAYAIATALAIFVIAIIVSSLYTDASFDGMAYHQEQVALIYEGWNPCLRQNEPAVSYVWVNHYPMGLETVGATFMSVTGHLQSAKAIIPIMAAMTFLLSLGLLAQIIPDTASSVRTWIAILIVGNPVIVAQLPSSYVDGTIAEYIVLTALLSIAIVVHNKGNAHNYLLLASVITMAVATKFNALLYELIVAAALFIGFLIFGYLRKSFKFFTVSLLIGVASVFLFSYYPYFTNWITAGNPLYPLAGEHNIDITSDLAIRLFGDDSNRFINFFRSLYTVNLRANVDSTLSGFSVTFTLLFPLSLAIIVIDAVRQRRCTPVLYIAICILLSCFIFKACWWPRYIPQLWLLAPLALYDINSNHSKYRVLISRTIYALWLIGTLLIATYRTFTIYRYNSHRNALYETLQGETIPMTGAYPQLKRLMNEHNINIIEIDRRLTPSEALNQGFLPAEYSLDSHAETIFTESYLWLTESQQRKFNQELSNTAFYRLYRVVKPNNRIIEYYNNPNPSMRQLETDSTTLRIIEQLNDRDNIYL